MNFFGKLSYILGKKNKIASYFILFLLITSALMEAIGLGLVLPFLSLLYDVKDYRIYNYFNSIFKNLSKIEIIEIFLIIILIIFFIKNLILTLCSVKESQFVWKFRKYLSENIIETYLLNKKNFLIKRNSSLILNILTKEISYLIHLLMNCFILISEFLILLSVSLVILLFHTYIFLTIFISVIFFFLFFYFFSRRKIFNFSNKRLTYDVEYLKNSTQIIESIREIKIYKKYEYFVNKFYKINDNIYNINWKLDIFQKISKFWLEFFILSIIIFSLSFLNQNHFEENFVITVLSVSAIIVLRILPSINRIFQSYQKIKIYSPSLKAIYEELKFSNLKKKLELKYDKQNKFLLKKKIIFKKYIKINNISFSYLKNKIINKLNFKIKKNSMIGIYGNNGSGKSTLLDIIFGFIPIENGKITVDGIDINYNLEDWQKKIAYIPQKVYLTDSSVLENITFNKNISRICKKKLFRVISKLSMNSMITNFPKGLNTIIGERGAKISGGQQQRIGLARALYSEPEILVMDEATNAIDQNSSQFIINSLRKMNNITRIIVTHDIEILKKCDEIYKVDRGSVKKIIL